MNRIDRIAMKMAGSKASNMRKAAAMQYQDVSDAVAVTGDDGYGPGRTEIWYMRSDFIHDGLMGYEWLVEKGRLPDPRNLRATHVLLGQIRESNSDKVYRMMQGERWSPEGEARSLIQSKGLRHTSMSMGDIIKISGTTLIVDTWGFEELSGKTAGAKVASKVMLRSRARDNHGQDFKAVLDFSKKPEDPTLVLEEVTGRTYGRWSWYLSTLLGTHEYSRGRVDDELSLDYGQNWSVTGMRDILKEAEQVVERMAARA